MNPGAVWASDIHLGHATELAYARFLEEIKASGAKVLLLSGDIAVSSSVCARLQQLQEATGVQIYFVLGNHDFYGGSFGEVRQRVKALVQTHAALHYLTHEGVIELNSSTALIGHDSWADGLAGDYAHSQVLLNDYYYIREFVGLEHAERGQLLQQLGQTATSDVRAKLLNALENYQRALLLVHVPPFPEGSLFQNKLSAPDWAPHFVCKQMGEMLVEVMRQYPHHFLTVLAGHSHHFAHYAPLSNMECFTAAADYGTPQLQSIKIML